MEEMFTIQEVSLKLKLAASTLYRYVETGKMKHKKIGRKIRFTNSQINDFLLRNDGKEKDNV
jgi:excisionase family DNA binding protein